MTTTAAPAPAPPHGRLANAFGRRQLYRYPDTWPRLGYLAIVVLTTIMLYYLYYVEGAVTPLMLPYYHMSFQFFLYLLVVSNAIGAFSAFIGGPLGQDRARQPHHLRNAVGGVDPTLRHPAHHGQVVVRRLLLRDRLRRGCDPRVHSRR